MRAKKSQGPTLQQRWDPWTGGTQGRRNHEPVQCEVESLVMAGFRPGELGGFDWESLRSWINMGINHRKSYTVNMGIFHRIIYMGTFHQLFKHRIPYSHIDPRFFSVSPKTLKQYSHFPLLGFKHEPKRLEKCANSNTFTSIVLLVSSPQVQTSFQVLPVLTSTKKYWQSSAKEFRGKI